MESRRGVRWREIDRQVLDLPGRQFGPVEQGDELFLAWLTEHDPIGGELTLEVPEGLDLLCIG